MAKCTCVPCNKIFKSEPGFNAHRVGEYEIALYKDGDTKRKNPIGHKDGVRRCLSTEEMIAMGMATNEKGWWILNPYDPKAHKDIDEVEEIDEPEEGFDEESEESA